MKKEGEANTFLQELIDRNELFVDDNFKELASEILDNAS
jgi:hypothetical protein